ncbi:MASE1 domain-containing protein [Sphingorhabdus sp.]|uniref:MASE1 domain-containing protein n=1 Tax=Sphingorhabdus sp. TaxID=1902408 RepID=UPI0039199CC0
MAFSGIAEKSLVHAMALYVACVASASITELLWTIPGSGISIWLPAGIVLAAMLSSAKGKWPLWLAAAVSAEMTGNFVWYGHNIGPAILLSLGNSIAVALGALVIRRFANQQYFLTTIKDTAILIVVAGFMIPLLSATSGSIGLGWSYGRPVTDFWLRLYLGDATGAIIAAPVGLLLLKTAAQPLRLSPRRTREAVALVVVFGAMAAISLGGIAPFAYLMIPPLLWASLSFRIPGAVVAIIAITMFTALFTLIGLGPFARPMMYIDYQNEALQLFLMVVATTGLLIGAIAEENRRGMRDLYALNQTLEDRVAERSASLAATESQAKQTANLLSAISESFPDQIYAKDLKFRTIYANKAALRIVNAKSIDDLQQIGEERLFTRPEEFNPIRANDRKVLKTRKTLVAEEIITDQNGVRKVYRTTKSPLFDSEGNLAGLAGVSVDISDMVKIQTREKMLVREVEHRARNLLAVVQGIVALSRADTVAELKDSLAKRIRALAHTNGAIAASDWEGADLMDILETELAPYRRDDGANVLLNGLPLTIEPATAQSLTLIIHELTTNAAKYGCLSTVGGQLIVDWTVTQDDGQDKILNFSWVETGGPPVSSPVCKGFGTTVISVFGQERPGSSVNFSWLTEGLCVKLILPLPTKKNQI